jgi:hypothetical protein
MTERGERIDNTHYVVEIWGHQSLTSNTLFYQQHQIPWSIRRNTKMLAFTGREWREGTRRFAEVEITPRDRLAQSS